jgi:glycosyltransferase involved in cell wall biosynthesis
MLDDPDERRRLGAVGIRRAVAFTWDAAAKQHVEVYERVAA